jgi:DNA-directed RNA polymerase delta subunit
MNKKHFIDIAYTLAKEKFAKKRFTFNSLYELLVKEAKLSNEERKDCIGTMYVELLQDSRFIYTGENL